MSVQRRLVREARERAAEAEPDDEERYLRKAGRVDRTPEKPRYAVPTPREMEAKRRRERAEWEQRRAQVEAEVYAQPDDRGYRAGGGDPLKTGVARATGMTARAGTRSPRWQYDEVEAGRSGR